MRLSIRILEDWLGDMVCDVKCKSSKADIEEMRLYSDGTVCKDSIIYIGSEDSITGSGRHNIICKHQNDMLVLRTDDLITVANKVQDAFCYYAKWFASCEMIIRNNGTLKNLLDCSVDVFPTPIIVVDAAQTFVAISSSKADFQDSTEWSEATKRGSVSDKALINYNLEHPDVYSYKHIFEVDPKYFFVKGYCKHIFINGARRASVILKVPGEDYSKGKLQIFDIFTELIKSWIISCEGPGNDFNTNSYFARALEGNSEGVAAMIRQTVLFNWKKCCPKLLFVLRSAGKENRPLAHAIGNLTHEAKGTYAMVYKSDVVILVNNDLVDHAGFNGALNSFIKRLSCCGAASFVFNDMNMLMQAYRIALSALEDNPSVPGVLYHAQDISLRRIVKILKEQAANTLQHPAIAILQDYDRKNKTDFYNTLFCYLRNERRHQATAEELFVHRNTLFQRLQKIEELLPVDLDDPQERFHLLFSFFQNYFGEE